MTFCIITHVTHSHSDGKYYGYAPYINEMNVWLKHVDKVIIVAPLKDFLISEMHKNYTHNNIQFIAVPAFSLTSFKEILKTITVLPIIFFKVFWAMLSSNHIHLRCPGNMGLIASIIQIFFPNKNKTAKYAGNWDEIPNQPLSYKIQKQILRNTFLTHNMQVLVYGEWKNQTRNIKSFFTATYRENEKTDIVAKKLSGKINFLFVGTLSKGKQPLYAIQIVQVLKEKGFNVQLSIYGSGVEYDNLNKYISENLLENFIYLKGISDRETMKTIYQESHFLILPSRSEGWPKVIAEAMFWGCLPIATNVSCVSNMLGFGNRGIILTENLETDSAQIINIIDNVCVYNHKINQAESWSRNYTLDKFETEIKQFLQ